MARSRRSGLDLSAVPFGSVFSDHMFVAEFYDGTWRSAAIRPYGALELPPNISALQYGVSVFEGLKAYRMPDGAVALFRPGENARRLNRSAARLSMPAMSEELFLMSLRELVRMDEAWVPPAGAGALYIRPCLFSTDPSVRVKPAERFVFVVFTFPFGDYYAASVDVLVTKRYVRAFPGGTGDVKPAGNYAPAMIADREAQEADCHTAMWLDGVEHRYVEECGVMNVFFVLEDEDGTGVVTPPLSGTILAGVTRDSVITLLRDEGFRVDERRIAIDEVFAAAEAGRLKECFGTGTAATLTHIRSIRFGGRRAVLPPVERRRVGTFARERLNAIAGGRSPDLHGWLMNVQ